MKYYGRIKINLNYDKALAKSRKFNYPSLSASILFNIGQVLLEQSNYDKALNTFLESYDMALNFNNFIILSEIENHIGLIYFQNKQFDKAMEYYIWKIFLHQAKLREKIARKK